MKFIRILLCYILLLVHSASWATIIPDTLYINKSIITIGAYNPVFCAFNPSPTFELKNPNYSIDIDDTLLITVINNDTIEHTFTIDGLITQNNYINAGNTESFIVKFSQAGSYAYYSKVPYGKQLGASGIIQAGYSEHKNYYWNLFDQEESLSVQLANGIVTSPNSSYRPQLFTINNLTYPATTSDMDGAIEEMVGDTIIISVYNSGKMHHTIHFHGYHVTILNAKKYTQYIGWSKDSFPVVIDELMTLQLVPDKPGMYPVHDHNLATVPGGILGGMMTKIHIME
jgi:hypothetical protein